MFRSDIDRREFLKRCYKIGGVAAIAGLGLGAVKDAMGWGIMPAIIGRGGPASWGSWDEASQEMLTVDFTCFHDGGLGENDVGYSYSGLITGTDRILTQYGNVPAVSGGYRQLTAASSQYFTATQNSGLLEAIFANAGKKWTIILKFSDGSSVPYFFSALFAGGVGSSFYIDAAAGGTLHIGDNNTADETSTTTTSIPTSGVVYLMVQADAVNKVRWGWQATKFTTWAAIPTNNKVETANVMGDFTTCTFTDASNGLYRYGGQSATAKVAYVVMDTTALL
uniref:Uncharacterized protein n=1 Tax=viral metagenome TaxID=1070528 RepID=A0A6M3XRX5_9ZZZZ